MCCPSERGKKERPARHSSKEKRKRGYSPLSLSKIRNSAATILPRGRKGKTASISFQQNRRKRVHAIA